jgi:dienelactone hydrolase
VVTYVNQAGTTVTAPRDVMLTVFAPDRPGTYPVIVYSHGHFGSGGANGGSGTTAQALANLGYIVILPNHLDSVGTYPSWLTSQFPVGNPASSLHRAADMQFALDMAQTLVAGLPGYAVDVSSPVVAGHSHGAFTAGLLVGLDSDRPGYDNPPSGNPYGLTSVADARFKAAILLSPQGADSSWANLNGASWDDIVVPLLIVTGTEDAEPGGMVDWNGRLDAFRNGDAAQTYALVYRDAAHNDIGGNTAIPGLTASIAGFIDRFVDGHVGGDAAARAAFTDPTTLLNSDPLLTQAYVRLNANTAGTGALTGTSGADTLTGLSSEDSLFGGDGDDRLEGGRGNDLIDGGGGRDTLWVQGSRADYRLLTAGDDFILKGPDGGDRLTGVEIIRFSNGGEIDLSRMYNRGIHGPQVLPGPEDEIGDWGKDATPLVQPADLEGSTLQEVGPTHPWGIGRERVIALQGDHGVTGADPVFGWRSSASDPDPWV